MSNQNESYGYNHYERNPGSYGQPQQPGQPPAERGDSDLAFFGKKIFFGLAALLLAPLVILFFDQSAEVRRRASLSQRPRKPKAAVVGIFIFPIVAAIASTFTSADSLMVAAVAPVAWLALAKHLPARHLIDFSTVKVITRVKTLPKGMLIGTGAALVLTAILAIADRGSLMGAPLILAGYPMAIALGRQRIKEVEAIHAHDEADRRLIGLALGLSEAQAAAMDVYRTGSEATENLQVHAGQLPLDVVGKLAGAEASIAAHAPEWEIISASAAGIILGLASEETIARREQLRQTGGLVAGVSEVQAPSAGFTASTQGFAPGDVF